MAGALDFLDTLVNRVADVQVAKAGGNSPAAAVGDESAVPYTSPVQVVSAVQGYLPYIIAAALIGGAAYFILKK